MEPVDVAVVGAGLAGLSAAAELRRAGRSVRVLEATDLLGGKVRTIAVGADHVDVGAHWIGPGQDAVAGLARELGVRTAPQPLAGRSVAIVTGRRYEHRASLPLLAPHVLADIVAGLSRTARAHRGLGYAGGHAGLDHRTLADVAGRLFRTRAGRALFDVSIRLIFGAESRDLSALHALAYIEAGGGLRRLSEFRGGAQQDFLLGGAGQLADGLAARLDVAVELDAPVLAVEQHADEVRLRTPRGEVRAARAIVAVPAPPARRIAWSPALPPQVRAFHERTSMGGYSKVVAVYERPWWRERGLNGIAVSTDGLLSLVVDGCATSGAGLLVAFSAGDPAHARSRMDPGLRRATDLEALVRLFGPAAGRPAAMVEQAWAEEDAFLGAPAVLPQLGALSRLGDLPRAPWGRVHWAGSDLARRWTGYMDGAVTSGREAARDVLARA